MLADIKELFSCEAIYLLSNWYLSKGARIEKKIAEELHLKIFFPGIEIRIDKENIITKETIDRAMRATEQTIDKINSIPRKDYLDTENSMRNKPVIFTKITREELDRRRNPNIDYIL